MNLNHFKKGDIIHRTQPLDTKVRSFGALDGSVSYQDYSYIEDALEVVDIKSGLLFYRRKLDILGNLKGDDKIQTLSLHRWGDDNWDYYPVEYLPSPEQDNELGRNRPEPPIRKSNKIVGDKIMKP